jgi:hypothetical protein
MAPAGIENAVVVIVAVVGRLPYFFGEERCGSLPSSRYVVDLPKIRDIRVFCS